MAVAWQVDTQRREIYEALISLAETEGWEVPDLMRTSYYRWLIVDAKVHGNSTRFAPVAAVVNLSVAVERLAAGPPKPDLMVGDKVVEFGRSGDIRVGCALVDYERLKEIYLRATKTRGEIAPKEEDKILTPNEWQVVFDVMDFVGGSPLRSRRGLVDSIREKVREKELAVLRFGKTPDIQGKLTLIDT